MKNLDPYVLARIQGLTLRAHMVAEGVLNGLHRSRHRGTNIEFAEHKEYSPGDDIRHMDWRAYARRDKYYIKTFDEDTNVRGYLLIDQSRSMSYQGTYRKISEDPSAPPSTLFSKFQYAQVLLASLAYLLLHQRDAVALGGICEEHSLYIPPRANWAHFHSIMKVLEEMTPQFEGPLSKGIDSLTGKLTRRGLVILFSDLFEDAQVLMTSLRTLRHHRHDLVVFHVLDPWEVEFPFRDTTRFEALEGESKITVDAGAIRNRYREEVKRFLNEIRAQCLQEHIEYHLARTDLPPDQVLTRFLEKREQRIG